MITSEQRLKIEEAKGYPLNVPDYSYLFVDGQALKIKKFNRERLGETILYHGQEEIALAKYALKKGISLANIEAPRTPVLAYGANASDIQLSSKYNDFNQVVIPVIKARLIDFDVVFTPYFAYDGSIPATIQYSPGTECEIAVTYLTEDQLVHMHKTESIGQDYNYIKLCNIQLILDGEILDQEVFCYNSLHGCFYVDHNHIAMKSIKAKNRQFRTMNEEELLMMVKNKLGLETSLDQFILDNIEHELLRKEYSKQIGVMAKEFAYHDWLLIEG